MIVGTPRNFENYQIVEMQGFITMQHHQQGRELLPRFVPLPHPYRP